MKVQTKVSSENEVKTTCWHDRSISNPGKTRWFDLQSQHIYRQHTWASSEQELAFIQLNYLSQSSLSLVSIDRLHWCSHCVFVFYLSFSATNLWNFSEIIDISSSYIFTPTILINYLLINFCLSLYIYIPFVCLYIINFFTGKSFSLLDILPLKYSFLSSHFPLYFIFFFFLPLSLSISTSIFESMLECPEKGKK